MCELVWGELGKFIKKSCVRRKHPLYVFYLLFLVSPQSSLVTRLYKRKSSEQIVSSHLSSYLSFYFVSVLFVALAAAARAAAERRRPRPLRLPALAATTSCSAA
jgi:hypothetical protein